MSDDRVLLRGLVCFGYHGVAPEETSLGQRFIVDLDLRLPLGEAGRTDDLGRTVDYAAVMADVQHIVEGPPLQLIEAVAERIAAHVLRTYPVDAVRVRVRKPDAPIPASFEYVGVEIDRARTP